VEPKQTSYLPLPHSPEAEVAYLGGILLGGEPDLEESSYFFLPFHRVIYRHILRLKNQCQPTNDLVLLVESIQASGELEAAGGAPYVAQLVDGLPKVSNLAHYADIIKGKAAIRDRLFLVESIHEKLANANGNAQEVLRVVAALAAPLTEEVGRNRILAFKTGADFAADATQPIEWIAQGLVAKGAITELGAKVKAGKTTLAMELVRSVLHGLPFLGLPTLKTPVVYLTEQPPVSFRQAMERAHLLSRDDFLVLAYNDTRRIGWPRVAAAAVRKCMHVGAWLLVVDTLSQFAELAGDRENNSGDALEAMGPLQSASANGIGIVVIRHERKSGGDVGDSGRGSSAFAGAVDIVLSLRKPEGNGPKTRRLLQSLSRFSETPSHLLIELREDGYVALGEPGETAVKDAKNAIFRIVPETEADAVDLKDLMDNAKISRQTAQRAIDELIRAGVLNRIGKGKKGKAFRYFMRKIVSAQLPT
jgi:hypothetical protein